MAKRKLSISPAAKADMEQIFKYISVDLCNPSAADNLIDDFIKALDNACMFPESCPYVSNEYVKDKTLRKLIVNSYIIFYSIKDDEILVVRVLYGMRNYESLL